MSDNQNNRGAGDNFDAAMKRRADSVQDNLIRRAIKTLKEQDKASGRQLPRDVLTYIRYVNERFLAAFSQEVDRPYALKGGNAIVALRANNKAFPSRFESPRETRDLDLRVDADWSEEDMRKMFARIVEDPDFRVISGLSFGEPRIVVEEGEDGRIPGARIECPVILGPPIVSKSKGIPFKLEMTFGALKESSWTISRFPALAEIVDAKSAFDNIGSFDVAHVVPEMMFADKLHAVVRYGLDNTRLKDVFDLMCLAEQYELDSDLIRDCLLHVFREFDEEHLLVASAAKIDGLDPKKFPTAERNRQWQDEWVNWTGYDFDADQGTGVDCLPLAQALSKVSAAVDEIGLFGKRTAAIADEARLNRTSASQVLNFARKAAAAVKPEDIEKLGMAITATGISDRAAAIHDLAFTPVEKAEADLKTPGVIRIAKVHAACGSISRRADELLAAFSEIMTDEEIEGLGRVSDTGKAMIVLIDLTITSLLDDFELDASVTHKQASEQLISVSADIPEAIGVSFPMREILSARMEDHIEEVTVASEVFRSAVNEIVETEEPLALERRALAARNEVDCTRIRDAIEESRRLARSAAGFCDPDEKRVLAQTQEGLKALSRQFSIIDRTLFRAGTLTEDIANGVYGPGTTLEGVVEKLCKKLPKEADWNVSQISKAAGSLELLPVHDLAMEPMAGNVPR